MALVTNYSSMQTGVMAASTKQVTQSAALLALLYAARRYYRNWGSTKEECQLRLPGDELVRAPVIQVTEAVWIEAPPSAVWRSVRQMVQDHGELQGNQASENGIGLHVTDNGQDHPERQQLAVGDVVRLAPKCGRGMHDGLALRVDALTPERSIVLRATAPNLQLAVWSFHVQPHWEDHTRLLARARVGLRHPGEVFAMELARPVITLLMRAVLLGIKRRRMQRDTKSIANVHLCT